jgi:hypothetical protein
MFEYPDPYPIRNDLPVAFRTLWRSLAHAGTWWTAAERIAIATEARRARTEASSVPKTALPDPAIEAAQVIGTRPSQPSRAWVDALVDAGLSVERYVELVAIVSQTSAVDAFHRGMGLTLEPLPDPIAGTPTRRKPDPPARTTKAWVPMTGPPSIPLALSAVPAEPTSWENLHAAMYLTDEQMADPDFRRGLHRTQMELVAARTSALNECFF